MRAPVDGSSAGWHKVLRWPAFLAANLAILLLVGVSTARESYRGWSIDREIRALDAQASGLEDRKLKLKELQQVLASPETVEKEARTRLGMKRDGERVYVLSGYSADPLGSGGDVQLANVPSEALPLTNPERWFSYFFGSNTKK